MDAILDLVENEEAQDELRDLLLSLQRALRRLGSDVNEERLSAVLENFCYSVADIEGRLPFLDGDISEAIRDWYTDLALRNEWPIAGLDDLDDPPSW